MLTKREARRGLERLDMKARKRALRERRRERNRQRQHALRWLRKAKASACQKGGFGVHPDFARGVSVPEETWGRKAFLSV
jgi:hypothetical protein